MAIRYATKTGNWSDNTVWNGGTLPGNTDDVYPNTYTVTVNQNVTANLISNNSASGVTAGGSFTLTNGYTVTSTTGFVAESATTALLTVAANATVTLVGDIRASTNSTGHGMNLANTGVTVNITGNVYGGRIGLATVTSVMGINIAATATGTITITGNVYGGGGSTAITAGSGNNGVHFSNGTTGINLTVHGNVYGGQASPANGSNGIYTYALVNCNITVIGNVYASSGNGYCGIGGNGTACTNTVLTVTGNVYGSAVNTTPYAIQFYGSSAIITGDIFASLGGALQVSNLTLHADRIESGANGTTGGTAVYLSGGAHTITSRSAIGLGGVIFWALGATANITVTEPVTTVGSGYALYLSTGTTSVTFVGTVDDSANTYEANSTGAIFFAVTNCTLTMTGDIIAGRRNGLYIQSSATGNVINITGNVTAGFYHTSTTLTSGIYSTASVTINVYGRVIATDGASNYGIGSATAGTIVFAQVAVSNNYPTDVYQNYGVSLSPFATSWVTVDAMESGSGGCLPTNGRTYLHDSASNYLKMRSSNAGPIVLMGDVAADYPAVTNVRRSIAYNFGSQVGTCYVPIPSTVAVNVPVDHTVGTAALRPEDVWNALTSGMNTAGSIGERAKNAATVETTGATLTGLL